VNKKNKNLQQTKMWSLFGISAAVVQLIASLRYFFMKNDFIGGALAMGTAMIWSISSLELFKLIAMRRKK